MKNKDVKIYGEKSENCPGRTYYYIYFKETLCIYTKEVECYNIDLHDSFYLNPNLEVKGLGLNFYKPNPEYKTYYLIWGSKEQLNHKQFKEKLLPYDLVFHKKDYSQFLKLTYKKRFDIIYEDNREKFNRMLKSFYDMEVFVTEEKGRGIQLPH